MIGEESVEDGLDVGWSRIEDGCLVCPKNSAGKHPELVAENNGHGIFWICPNCRGSYGPVQATPNRTGAAK